MIQCPNCGGFNVREDRHVPIPRGPRGFTRTLISLLMIPFILLFVALSLVEDSEKWEIVGFSKENSYFYYA